MTLASGFLAYFKSSSLQVFAPSSETSKYDRPSPGGNAGGWGKD